MIFFFSFFLMMFPILRFVYERQNQDIILGFSGIVFISYFSIGIIRFYLALVRKSEIKTNLLLIDWKKFIHIWILFSLYYTVYILLIKVIEDLSEYEGIMKIRVIFGIFLFFWLLTRLIFSPFFVVDKGYSARKALKSSFLLTSGRTIKTAILLLFSTLFLVSGFLLLGLGIIYSFSLFMIAFVIAYDINLKNRFSRRKKLIQLSAIETRKQINETLN